MQPTETSFYESAGPRPALQATTEPVGGVDSIPINPSGKPFSNQGRRKKRPLSPDEEPSPPSSSENPSDTEHHVDEYA